MNTAANLRLLIFSTILCCQLHAQQKDFPGSYISVNGDSVRGVFTNYNEWNTSPEVVHFMSQKKIELTPANCVKFFVDNHDEYIAYLGKRLINPLDENEAFNSRGFITFNDTSEIVSAFLRLVTRVPGCDLHVLSDAKRINLFYQLPGQSLVELKFKKYYETGEVHSVETYKQQLKLLFPEQVARMKLKKALDELPYAEEAIGSFLKKLFPVETVENHTARQISEWIITGGVSINAIKETTKKPDGAIRGDYTSSVSPVIGIGVRIPFYRNLGKYFVYPQLRLHSFKGTSESSDWSFKTTTTYQCKLVLTTEVNVGMYILKGKDLQVFLSGGGGLVFLMKSTGTIHNVLLLNNSDYSTYPIEMASTSYNLNLSAGISLKKKLLLQAAYNFPARIADVRYYMPMHSSLQLGVGYKLN